MKFQATIALPEEKEWRYIVFKMCRNRLVVSWNPPSRHTHIVPMSIIHRFFVENIEENDIVLTSEMEHVFSTLTSLYDVLTMKSRQRDIHSWTTYEIHIYDVELHLIGLYIFNNSWVSPFNVSPNMLPILFGARGPQFPISQIIFQLS